MRKKKTAVITGAGRGIGRAVALRLAREDFNLFLTARSENELRETVRDASSEDIFAFPADLSEEESAKIVVQKAAEIFGGIDVLVNNAGAASACPAEDLTCAEWERLMHINARAPFLLCREAIQFLRESCFATIINISSVVGHTGYGNQCAYTASKHALSGFTRALARELHGDGIRVHLISPGGVATGMVRETRPDLPEEGLIAPGDIAETVIFLLSLRGSNSVLDEVRIRRASSAPQG